MSRGGGRSAGSSPERHVWAFARDYDSVVAALSPGRSAPVLDRIEGTDPHGIVACVVSRLGVVTDVRVDDSRGRTLGVARLGNLILAAYRDAASKAELARMILAHHGHWISRPENDVPTALLSPLPSWDSPSFLPALDDKIRESRAVLNAADRASPAAEQLNHRVLSGPAGLVRLTVFGTQLESVEIDQYVARTDAVADDALAVLREFSARPSGPVIQPEVSE